MWFKHRDKTLGINLDLVKDMKLTFEELCQLIECHKIRSDLFEFLEFTNDRKLIKIIFHQLIELEMEIQMIWGFEPNVNKTNSYKWPKCICPYSDNTIMPDELRWVNLNCPLHD